METAQMGNVPRRRPPGTGPSRPAGRGLRAGRSTAARAGSRVSTTLVDPALPAEPGTAEQAAAAPRPASRRGRMAGSRPAATRPASAPSTATGRRFGRVAPAAGSDQPAAPLARSRFALHVAVLGLVFCAVAFILAVPLRNYLSQRSQLAAAVATEHDMTAQKALLQQQQSALSDPAYLESEAKRRLLYVMPGETVYVVHAPAVPKTTAPAPPAAVIQRPWYSSLWDTMADPVPARAGG